MMHDVQKSDAAIVPAKAANKEEQSSAEPLERRAASKRNAPGTGTDYTQGWVPVSPGAERVRQHAKENPEEKLTALPRHVDLDALRDAFYGLKPQAAPGADGITWRMYEENLEENLLDLKDRVLRQSYRATPVRRVEIPKPDGGTRALGIASIEDKILQRAVCQQILDPIYESEFAGFSYGFRPKRSAHDALDALAYAIERRKVNWMLDADIKSFFDQIDRERLMSFLEERIGDRRVLRLIRKWLSTGVLEAGVLSDTVQGTPQGAPISPLLANVYLHKVLDSWFAKEWRPERASGEVYIVRYADDFVLAFQHRSDAARFAKDLQDRLKEYGLELADHKTRLIEFGRYAQASRRKRGEGRPETFDFLGFTHYCRIKRNGRFGLGRKPIAKRVRRTLKAIKERLRAAMHDDPAETGQWLGMVLQGWFGYYAVPTSSRHLSSFKHELERLWLHSIRRRSQNDRFPWERLRALSAAHLPPARILHPWPAYRFAVKYPS